MFIELGIFVALAFILKLCWENCSPFARKLPPGPIRWPIIGTIPQILWSDPIYYVGIHKLSQKYGEVMSLKLGSTFAVVVSTLDSVKIVLNKEEAFGRYQTGIFFERVPIQNKSLAFSNGESWKRMRKYCVHTLKHYGFSRRHQIEGIIHSSIDQWTELVLNPDIRKGEPILFSTHYFSSLVSNIIVSQLAGKKYEIHDPNINNMMKAGEILMKDPLATTIANVLPLCVLKMWPKLFGYDIERSAVKLLNDSAQPFLDEARDVLEAQHLSPDSFIEDFALAIENDKASSNPFFTDEQFRLTFGDIVLAGTDTSSSTSNFAFLFLSLNPNVQELIFREIVEVVGLDRKICTEDKLRMPYTQATATEIGRMARVAPLLLPRVVLENFKYKGHLIPKGTALFGNAYGLLFDEEFWGDPHVFRPERFLSESGKFRAELLEYVMTFSTGKRNCIGESLSTQFMFLFLGSILQNYKLEIPTHLPPPSLEPLLGFGIHAQPFYLNLKPRIHDLD